MARVFFEGISKRFGDTYAVRDLTLEVQDEEFFVLLGPSGCGKTTALRMAAACSGVPSRITLRSKPAEQRPGRPTMSTTSASRSAVSRPSLRAFEKASLTTLALPSSMFKTATRPWISMVSM